VTRVLLVGESWVIHSIHVKGFDSFTTSEYAEGGEYLLAALRAGGAETGFIPAHLVPDTAPETLEELAAWDVVILSDIGTNSLLISRRVWAGEQRPNRLDLLEQWVREGGSLVMCGGFMTFAGIDGKARYHGTPIESALPVEISPVDDRVENPADNLPAVIDLGHPITRGLPTVWPGVLGYNRLVAKAGASVLMTVNGDPFVVAGEYGRGRSLAYAGDIGPHWGPRELVTSDAYTQFWARAVGWLCTR
jgi:uncharacterized membrane protein